MVRSWSWSQPYCAREALSFNLMPWPYKAMDLSEMVVPASATWAAGVLVLRTAATHPWATRYFGAFLIIVWCAYLPQRVVSSGAELRI